MGLSLDSQSSIPVGGLLDIFLRGRLPVGGADSGFSVLGLHVDFEGPPMIFIRKPYLGFPLIFYLFQAQG